MILQAGLLLSPLLLPPIQDAEAEGSATLRRDAEFAQALANEYRFFDLAETVLEKSLTRANNPTDRSLLLLSRCEVRQTAAEHAPPEEKLEAFSSAAKAYDDFLAVNPPTQLAHKAQNKLSEVAFLYGESLEGMLRTEELDAARKDALREDATSVFETGLNAANTIIEWFKDLPTDEQENQLRTYYVALWYRSLIYYYWGLIYPQGSLERNENCRLALEHLEQFTGEVGYGSRASLLGNKFIADVYAARGDAEAGDDEEAVVYYEYVIEEGIPQNAANPLPPAEIDARLEIMQHAYLGLLEFYKKRGRDTEVRQLAADFQQWRDDENLLLSIPGYRMLLRIAEMHAEEGDFGTAIELTRLVAEENAQNILRLEANAIQRRILGELPEDAEVDLEILYQAGEGAFFQDKFAEAVEGLRGFLPRLENSADREEYGAKAYYYLGRSWDNLGRDLEAAAAYQQGYELYPDHPDLASRFATAWYRKAELFAQKAPDDEFLDQFMREALDAQSESGDGDTPDAALWRRALTDYNNAQTKRKQNRSAAPDSPEAQEILKGYDRAIASFGEIPKGSRYYERAIVQRGMSTYWKMQFDPSLAEDAFKIFNDYLEVYLPNPQNTPVDAPGRKSREEASAQADYYRGQVRVTQAQAATGDRADQYWSDVLRLYTGYSDRHEDQPDYSAGTSYFRLIANLELGNLDQAVAEYERLVADGDETWVSPSAFALFDYHNRMAEAREGDEKFEHLALAANYLHIHNQAASRPKHQNLLEEARLRLELKEPSTASEILQSVLTRFEDDESFSEGARFFAKLDLIDALLAQDRVGEAKPYVDDLKESRPNNLRVKEAFIKVNVGYLEWRDGGVVEVPGEGGDEALDAAEKEIFELVQLAEADAKQAETNKFRFGPWWEAALQRAYYHYQRSQMDSTFAGQHRTYIESLEKLAPDLGADVLGDDFAATMRWLKAQP